MSRRVVTKEDVLAARGGTLEIGPDDLVTAAALEASARASVQLVRREGSSEPAPATPPSAAPWDSFAPGAAGLSAADGAPAAVVTAVGRNRPFVLAEITT